MTQNEIIEMAMQVGGTVMAVYSPDLIAFAKLVAQHEREACAKICDAYSKESSNPMNFANNCAETIRARSKE